MGAALYSLVHNFMIPILHCERLNSCAFVGNLGSKKVHVSQPHPSLSTTTPAH